MASLAKLAEELDLDQPAAQRLVMDQPRFLDLDGVRAVLADLRHLMPKQDPRRLLLSDPSWLLRVQRGQKHLGQHPDT